ncbi:MAG: isoaspartyl peptidase/L-asparaginase [Bacteroidota bacterium]
MSKTAIALHGGAGTILRKYMTPEKEQQYLSGLEEALTLGDDLLKKGAAALDAAEATVRCLENNPLFNAGKGAVYAGDGTHLLDASIMRGDTLEAGAVAGVRGVKNPISLARRVMEASAYVMMIGEGAEEFGRKEGLEQAPPEYFHDDLRFQQWQRIKDSDQTILDHADKGERNFSTVGAVCLDREGNLAGATSTGGMTNKRYGRVGDSPIIGAGTYANNATCAVCCTGHGEPFIRAVVAHRISCLMEYKGMDLQAACDEVIHRVLKELKGEGGVIAVDPQGHTSLTFNTAGMYRAAREGVGAPVFSIYGPS